MLLSVFVLPMFGDWFGFWQIRERLGRFFSNTMQRTLDYQLPTWNRLHPSLPG